MNRQKGRVALRLLAVVIGAFVLAGVFMAAGRLLAAHIPWISIESPESGEVVFGIIPVSCEYGINGGSMHTLILYAGGAEADRIRVGGRLGSHTFFLDTSDYSDGPIQISIRAYSAAPPSSHYSTASVNVIIENAAGDEEPPEIDILSPDNGELFPASSVVLSASLMDDVAVDPETVVVKLDDANITAQCDVSALSVFCSLSPADGSHTATIDCADTSGNAAPRASVSLVVDTTPPALAVTSHENGQVVTTPTITVSGTASDATSGVASVEVNGEAVAIFGGVWTMPGVSLDEGANAIAVTAEDAAGHVANYILIINYDAPDTSKPVITIEEPTAGALLDAAPVVLSAELEDNEAVATATVVVKLDGADVTAGCAVTPFSVICPLSPADGTHSATVDCKDTSNNAAVKKSVSFTLDTAPPVVSVTSHADGQVVVAPVITLSGSASDAVSGVSSVEVNGEAATLSGGTWTFFDAALDEGLNAFVVSAQDVAGHSAVTSLTINYVIPDCSSDADCDDADVRTDDVCLNPGTAGAVCVHNGIECITDADCGDDDVLTLDTCASPGTAQSSCVNAPIDCATDADCDDADALTIDVCENPLSASSLCVNTAIACNTDADCDDADNYTLDSCLNPGTIQSLCSSVAIECLSSADCDDSDARTEDVCLNPGTAGAVCVHNGIECLNDADCDDDDAHTLDSCVAAGTTDAECAHTPIACLNDADCDDADAHTLDTCVAAGTADAACSHAAVACLGNTDCDDSNPMTLDACLSPGTAQSSCVNNSLECASAADCDDGNPLTISECLNPGSAQASCAHTPIACNTDADCDDQNEYTINTCVNGGALNAECIVATIACLSDADCNDDDERTLDYCVFAGTSGAECSHTPIACSNDADCDDDNPYTIDTCAAAGTADASCSHAAVACITDTDCDDSNPLTLDACVNARIAESVCSNVACEVACETDADCDDGDPLTAGACENAGTCDASCAQTEVVPEPEEPAQLTLKIVAPVNGHITNSLALTVNGEATIGATVSVNGMSAAVGEDGAFSAVLNLEEGANTIIASATLADDTITKEVEITADTTSPSVISVAPDDGALFEISPDRIAVRVEDNPGGVGLDSASVRLFLDGEELISQYVATSGAYEASPGAMPSGRRIVTMTAFDLAGNSIEWAGSFVVAGRGPKITIKKLPGWVDGARGYAVAPVQYSDDESVPSDEQQEPVEALAMMQSLASPSSPFSAIASSSSVNIETMLALLKARKQEGGMPWKFPEVADAIAAEYEQRGTLPDELPDAPALKGTMEALVEETDAPLDIESIEAIVDGRPVESEYDAQTKTLTASLDGFAPGEYEATFTASDIDGNETMTMETFNLTYSVDALMLENVTSPGDQISFGDTFRIRLDSSHDELYTPWATLYNTDNTTVYPGGVGPCYGSHFVTSGFNLQHIEGTEYSYEAQGPLYTTLDLDGNEASHVIAVTLMSAYNYEQGVGECLYSSISMEVVGEGAPQISSGSITNVNHPEWKTVAVGESARIEVEATPGAALECVIAAGLFTSDGEPSILTTSQMIETQQGVYVCEAVIDSRPDVEGESAHFVLAVIQSHGVMLSIIDDFITYRENINEVHLRNISRTGASDIAPGEMFEITAAGVSGMTELPALILDMAVFSSNIDGPFQFASPLVEVSPGSGEYRIEATLDVVPEGVTAIRAAVGHPDMSVKPALSTEFLTVIPFAPAAPTLITHIDGVEVQEGYVASDNFEPVVAGTAEHDSTVNVYRYDEDGSFEISPVPDGPSLYAVYQQESIGYYTDNYDDGIRQYWGYGGSDWPGSCESVIETDGVLRLRPLPGGGCSPYDSYITDWANVSPDYFKLKTDIFIPSASAPTNATIEGLYRLSFLVDGESQRDMISAIWGIDIQNASPAQTSLEVRINESVVCATTTMSVALDEWKTFAIEYIQGSEQSTFGVYIDESLAMTCDAQVHMEGRVTTPRIDATASLESEAYTIDIDNFQASFNTPAGYRISGPAFSIDQVAYDMFGDSGLYLSVCGVSPYGPQPLPQLDSCVDGSADINVALATIYNMGLPDGGVTADVKATMYTIGGVSDAIAYMEAMVAAQHIGGYKVDAFGPALIAQGVGNPYLPAIPVQAQEPICLMKPGAPGWLRWNSASQQYLASRTPFEYNGIQFSDYVIWGLTETGESGFIINQDDTPVWWADGEENISAATIEFFDGNRNVNATVFSVASFINDLPNMGVTVHAVAHDILIAPNDPKGVNTPDNPEDDHYTWNPAALDAAGIGLAPSTNCVGGLFELIGTTTSDPEGAFSALVTVPFTAPGDHIILARSFNPQTGALISQSPTVTYHINESGDIVCDTDADCDDGIALTLDACVDPGTIQSTCLHTQIACNTDADCDDGNAYTINTCVNGGTLNSECVVATIACLSDSDCNDENAYTLDACIDAGTADAACSHATIACLTDSDCNDDDAYTIDSCVSPGMADAACSHSPIACLNNSDCDDGNPLTIDTCLSAGTAQSACENTAIACNIDADCDDGNAYTINTCVNGGALNAECAVASIACLSDSDCNDENAYTIDSCVFPGTAEAACSHTPIACLNNSDCDDDNPLTIDICLSAGTAQSACENTAIACNIDADCDDNNALTLDACVDPGTIQSTCSHTDIIPADTTPPVIVFTSHTNGDLTNNPQPTIVVSITDAETGVDWATLECVAPVACAIARVTGTDTAQITLAAPLPEGANTIHAIASDLANPANTASEPISLIIDTTPPAITILNPQSGNWVAPGLYTARVRVVEANGIDRVQMRLNTTYKGDADCVESAATPGEYICEYEYNFSGMHNQNPTIGVVATDIPGNSSEGTVTFTVKNNASQVVSATLTNLTNPSATSISVGEKFKLTIRTSNSHTTPQFRIVNANRWPAPDSDIAFTITASSRTGNNWNLEGTLLSASDDGGNSFVELRAAASTNGFTTVVLSNALILDTGQIPPAKPTITRPRNNQTVGDKTVDIRGKSDPGTIVTIYIGAPGAGEPLSPTAVTAANGNYQVNITFELAGEKTIYAVAEKITTGALSEPSDPRVFRIRDRSIPVIEDLAAAPNPFSPDISIGSKDATTITANIYDETLSRWQIEVRNSSNTRMIEYEEYIVDPSPQGPNPVSFTWDGRRHMNNGNIVAVPEGVYTYRVRARDEFNNQTAWITGTVRIDKTPPTVAIASPPNGAAIVDAEFTIVINAADNIAIDHIVLYVDGQEIATIAEPVVPGRYEYTFLSAQIGPGVRSISVVAVDTAGNQSVATVIHIDVVYAIDTDPPTLTNASASEQYISPAFSPGVKDTVTFSATAADKNPSHWTLRIEDAAAVEVFGYEEAFISSQPDTPIDFSYTWDGTGSDETGNLPDGVYTYIISAYDAAGNVASATSPITIDNTPPSALITSPEEGRIVGGITFAITVEAADNFDVASVALYVDGELDSQAVQTATETWRTTLYPHLHGDGPHVLSVIATDPAGNPSSTLYPITLGQGFFSPFSYASADNPNAASDINIIIDTVAPKPPINLRTNENPTGAISLSWIPPTTNTDGSPLSDLAGYNIYLITQTGGCEPVSPVSGDAVPVSCGNGDIPDAFEINGPSFNYNGIDFNSTPAGNSPVWLDASSPQNTFAALPFSDVSSVNPSAPVYVYLLQAHLTGNDGLPAGVYFITAYSQAHLTDVESWLYDQIRFGALGEDSKVVALAPACVNAGFSGSLSASPLPLLSVPFFVREKVNTGLISPVPEPEFLYDSSLSLPSESMIAATAVDSAGNESVFSNFVRITD